MASEMPITCSLTARVCLFRYFFLIYFIPLSSIPSMYASLTRIYTNKVYIHICIFASYTSQTLQLCWPFGCISTQTEREGESRIPGCTTVHYVVMALLRSIERYIALLSSLCLYCSLREKKKKMKKDARAKSNWNFIGNTTKASARLEFLRGTFEQLYTSSSIFCKKARTNLQPDVERLRVWFAVLSVLSCTEKLLLMCTSSFFFVFFDRRFLSPFFFCCCCCIV